MRGYGGKARGGEELAAPSQFRVTFSGWAAQEGLQAHGAQALGESPQPDPPRPPRGCIELRWACLSIQLRYWAAHAIQLVPWLPEEANKASQPSETRQASTRACRCFQKGP
uniref:Uncharacterized protein n=1 Tax=Caudovirales sp. ctSxd6 TaxID=2826774 RepID=A0A8S5NDY8_9CAUD|nr:MAG TPA: hypothetical protein [Caudovirales sp. ctSxd6]